MAARVRLFKEFVEVFLPVRGAGGPMGGVLVLMAAGLVSGVVVAMARHVAANVFLAEEGEEAKASVGPQC